MSLRPANALLLILLAFGGYVMLADYSNLRQARSDRASEASQTTEPWPQPWGGYAERERVIFSGADWMISPQVTSDLIEDASPHYPLDARQWLDLAQINVAAGSPRQVDLLLDKAIAVRPLHRPTLWSAAQIALQTGDADLAERQLRQWLQLYPGDTGQALFIGRRWISDPGELVDRMLPPQREYLVEAMQVALRRSDFALADEVWKRLEPKPDLNDPTFLQYVELLLGTGQVAHATELWADRDPYWRPGMLVNGDFARDLGESLGLNWRRTGAPPGVVIGRDLDQSYSSPASLRVAFNGKENVRLSRPMIRIPATPGGRYRLSGVWRAEGLTTRALPYLQLSAEGSRFSEIVAVRDTEFDWRSWSIEFTVPEDSQLMRLALRRDSTRAFDRNIDGELWLDEFRLEPIVETQRLQPVSPETLEQETSAQTAETVSVNRVEIGGMDPAGAASGRDPDSAGAESGHELPSQGERPTTRGLSTGAGASPAGDGESTNAGSLAGQAPTAVGGPEGSSARDESAQDTPPMARELSTGAGASPAGDGDLTNAGSLAGQAPAAVDGSAAETG